MSTWTCKAALWALVTIACLGACSDTQALSFASVTGIAPGERTERTVRQTRLLMADGRVALRTPDGYCIDQTSLGSQQGDRFAVVARCDMVGASTGVGFKALAMITVTVQPFSGDTPPSADDLADAVAPARGLEQRDEAAVALVRLNSGAPDLPGIDQQHWRGVFVVNGQLVALGLYAPEAGVALGARGATLLRNLAQRTVSASNRLPDPGTVAAAE